MTATKLMEALRRSRVLGRKPLERLAHAWPADAPAERCVDDLLAAGLVTPFQAEEVLAGRGGWLRIGPYRLLARLGAGAGGTVYKAEHSLLGRVVALKVMKRRKRPTGRREARAAVRVSHPNIVAARDAGIWRGRLVLVLEYAEGIDLGRLVREYGPLPAPLLAEAAWQGLEALGHLHGQGLVHRDVKPENLILIQGGDGAPPVFKLLDLGLAQRVGRPDRSSSGTPDFLAPERGGGGPLSPRSDLWSLGCTLHLLATGQLPFPGETEANRYLSRKLDDPPPTRTLRPDLPPALERLILRLLARDPDSRPASAQEALSLLNPAPPPPPPLPPRPRRAKLALITLALGLMAGGAARVALEPAESRPETAAEAPRGGSTSGILAGGQSFASLAEAVAGVPPGSTITLHGPGPFRADGLEASELILRAAPGSRPVVESSGDGWEPALAGGSVFLEGVEVRSGPGPAAMIQATRRLVLRDCVLVSGREGPAVALRQGASLRLQGCRLSAVGQGVSLEAGEGMSAVELIDSEVRVTDPKGAGVVLWGRPGPISLIMDDTRVWASRKLANHANGPVRWAGLREQGSARP
jgi:hypothetical protein